MLVALVSVAPDEGSHALPRCGEVAGGQQAGHGDGFVVQRLAGRALAGRAHAGGSDGGEGRSDGAAQDEAGADADPGANGGEGDALDAPIGVHALFDVLHDRPVAGDGVPVQRRLTE